MSMHFAQTLKNLRMERGLSQKELAAQICVTRSTIAHWENGRRLPDASMLFRISERFNIDVKKLLSPEPEGAESLNVIMVDDSKIILTGGLSVLEEVLPNAAIIGFTQESEAIEYAKANNIALAFLDIELRNSSGFDLCQTLLDINPRTNVVFLTAYIDYSFDAWNTGACGFLLKPITPEVVQAQLEKLRYPLTPGQTDDRTVIQKKH